MQYDVININLSMTSLHACVYMLPSCMPMLMNLVRENAYLYINLYIKSNKSISHFIFKIHHILIKSYAIYYITYNIIYMYICIYIYIYIYILYIIELFHIYENLHDIYFIMLLRYIMCINRSKLSYIKT